MLDINLLTKKTMKVNDNLLCNSNKPLSGNDIAPPLNEGQVYSLIEIHTCKCGKEHLNVGLPMEVNYVRCYDCSEELPLSNHWCHPSRFTVIEIVLQKQ